MYMNVAIVISRMFFVLILIWVLLIPQLCGPIHLLKQRVAIPTVLGAAIVTAVATLFGTVAMFSVRAKGKTPRKRRKRTINKKQRRE